MSFAGSIRESLGGAGYHSLVLFATEKTVHVDVFVSLALREWLGRRAFGGAVLSEKHGAWRVASRRSIDGALRQSDRGSTFHVQRDRALRPWCSSICTTAPATLDAGIVVRPSSVFATIPFTFWRSLRGRTRLPHGRSIGCGEHHRLLLLLRRSSGPANEHVIPHSHSEGDVLLVPLTAACFPISRRDLRRYLWSSFVRSPRRVHRSLLLQKLAMCSSSVVRACRGGRGTAVTGPVLRRRW